MMLLIAVLLMMLSGHSADSNIDEHLNKLSVTLSSKERTSPGTEETLKFPNQSHTVCDVYCAYSTMYYHRSKMSEYLCHQYLTDEILDKLGGGGRHMIPTASKQTALLDDLGSSGYTTWLHNNNYWDRPADEETADEVDTDESYLQADSNEYESGDITGYAVTSPAVEHYPAIYTESYGKVPAAKEEESWPSPKGKSFVGEDFLDIALSALAFLAFGSFISNLIITCIFGNQNSTVVIQMSTTTMASTGTGTGRDGSMNDKASPDGVDQLANMVLITLDKLEETGARSRGGTCLQYSLCKNNRINKALEPSQRIWLPLWSFAMSWLSGRWDENRLENLRASILGLGGASCRQLYPNCA